VKRSEREADYSLPCGDEIKNEWSCTTSSPLHLHGVKEDNFTVYESTEECDAVCFSL